MACISDGGCNYRQYTCQRCGLVWERFVTNDEDDADAEHFERYGTDPSASRMCPRCNSAEVFEAWGVEADEVRDA